MSTELVKKALDKAKELLSEGNVTNTEKSPRPQLRNIKSLIQRRYDELDPDDKKTENLRKRVDTTLERIKKILSQMNKGEGVRELKNKTNPIKSNARGGSISKLKAGGFPDMSGDGKVTKKDVLIGRGVIKKQKGGEINGLKKMGMKQGGLAGRLAQRGYGKARS
jgi:soluble cytochrome b562